MTRLLPLLFGHALFSLAHAAQPISLGDAFDRAARNSPHLQKSLSMRESARWSRVDAFSTWLPTLNGNLNYMLQKKYMFFDVNLGGGATTVPQVVPTSIATLGANYTLFDGFASTNRLDGARRIERAAESEYEWAAFQLRRDVALHYYRALAAKSLRQVAEANVSTLKDHLSDTRAMRRSGLSTNYDVLRVEVQVSEAESALVDASDNIALSAGRLAEALGVDDELDPTGHFPELGPELVAKINPEPGPDRKDLAALTMRAEGLELRERASARHWVPQVGWYGTYFYYNNRNERFDDFDSYRNAWQMGVQLSWNLFDGFRSTAAAHQAVEARVQAEKSRRASLLKARQDLNVWTRKFKYYTGVYKSRQGDIGKATESVRLAREGRRAGARTNTDLLDAESDLFRAQAGAISAQLGTVEALINVELAAGQTLIDL